MGVEFVCLWRLCELDDYLPEHGRPWFQKGAEVFPVTTNKALQVNSSVIFHLFSQCHTIRNIPTSRFLFGIG